MTESKDRMPWGAIDQIARMLEEVAPQCEALWDDGHYRMNKQEVRRLAIYLSRIRVSSSRMRDALKAFETLVDRNPIVLRKIAKLETKTEEQIQADSVNTSVQEYFARTIGRDLLVQHTNNEI